ncbi:hypothetical protein BJ508DRAFT_412136 [Ascobolus immersus RN42]|uniref:Uncharacterized protein n=1 Tax=Ascobolus immersus RN42 TaxID=1160509 RepID=A0A3N4IGS9_ASCIM|nr:hypothetical protein BJ508DRAFT_412136 [Ascobolus immersus RN42]
MATPRPRGSTDSIHLGVNGGSSNNHNTGGSSSSTTAAGGNISDSVSTKGDTTPERPDIFGDLLRTVPGASHSEEDLGLSFVFPPVPQQVTIQTNHQRQESQRVLARSPSPPRMSSDTLAHTLNHRTSMSHKGSQSSIATPIPQMNNLTPTPTHHHHQQTHTAHPVIHSHEPTPTPFTSFPVRKPGTETDQVHTFYILTLRDTDAESSTSSKDKHTSTSSTSSSRAHRSSTSTNRKRARMEAPSMETVDEEVQPVLDYIWWCIDVPYSEKSCMEPLEVVKEFQKLPTELKNAVIRMETELEIMGTDKSVIKWINYEKESKTLSLRYLQNARDVDSSTWD